MRTCRKELWKQCLKLKTLFTSLTLRLKSVLHVFVFDSMTFDKLDIRLCKNILGSIVRQQGWYFWLDWGQEDIISKSRRVDTHDERLQLYWAIRLLCTMTMAMKTYFIQSLDKKNYIIWLFCILNKILGKGTKHLDKIGIFTSKNW